MREYEKAQLKRAIIPALVIMAIMIGIGIATKRSVGVIVILAAVALPLGYVAGNAGKWGQT